MTAAPAPGGTGWQRRLVIGLPFAWLLAVLLVPFLTVVGYSLAEMGAVAPEPLVRFADGAWQVKVQAASYLALVQDPLYAAAFASSLKYAAITTVLCLAIGYPFAYFMARARATLQPALVMLVLLPFWTSFLLRVYAWKTLLNDGGWVGTLLAATGVESALLALGWIGAPGRLMNTPFSLVLGMVASYLPFMVLPLYATLARLDPRLLEAAADLGARPWTAFWRVTVPLSRNGIAAGCMLVAIPCVGEFVAPELLGGPQTLMVGRVLWDEFFSSNDWPRACAVTVAVVLLVLVPLAVYQRAQERQA